MKVFQFLLLVCALGAFGGATVTVDPATKYNTNDGWETTTVWANTGSDNYYTDTLEAYRDQIADIAVNQIGLNRVRIELRSGSENPLDNFALFQSRQINFDTFKERWYHKVNDNNNPNVANANGFHFSELDYQMENVILPMKRKLEERGEALYLNLQLVDLNDAGSDRDGDGKHPTSNLFYDDEPDEYAELIYEAFKHLATKYGFIPDSLEIILEPDNTHPLWPAWDGATGVDIANNMIAAVKRLEAAGYSLKDVIGPSVVNAGNADKFFDEMISVPGALEMITMISYHAYQNTMTVSERQNILSRANAHGLKTGMLEYTKGDGFHWFFEALNTHISSYERWGYAAEHESTYIKTDLTDPKAPTFSLHDLTKDFTHIFPYIRPGATQIASSGDSVAYINPNGGYTVIISNVQGDYGAFSIKGLPAGTYEIISYGRDGRDVDTYGVTYPDRTISSGETLTLPSVTTSRGLITVFTKGSKVVTDTQAPSVPQNLTASSSSTSQVDLSWDASTDNVGVFRYRIFRNGFEIGVSENTRFIDTTVTTGSYTYEVSAFDASLRESAKSQSVRVNLGGTSVGVFEDVFYTDFGSYIEISGLKSGFQGDLYIPDTIGEAPVTHVAANAFKDETGLTGVVFGIHITSLGSGAFAGASNLNLLFFEGHAPQTVGSNALDGLSTGGEGILFSRSDWIQHTFLVEFCPD